MTVEDLVFGDRIAELRHRRGLSQRQLAAAIGRSESWVSQVERGVQPVQRLPVLRRLADALGVPAGDLRPEAGAPTPPPPATKELPARLDGLRAALAGHPAPDCVFPGGDQAPASDTAQLRERVDQVWQLVHGGRFEAAAQELTALLPTLESAVRSSAGRSRRAVSRLLAGAYQAAAAALAHVDDSEAAWVAADRSIRAGEDSGQPLEVIAGLYRMAHVFLRLGRLDLAESVAASAARTLAGRIEQPGGPPQELALYGALQLARAVIAARANERQEARRHVGTARQVAGRLGEDRNDFGLEFSPTSVEVDAVTVAVDLGDAGEALEAAAGLDVSSLSAERQARLHLDIARAHAQRHHVGEALKALLTAEQLSPEQVHGHAPARETILDLLGLSGRRPSEELQDLARRCGVIP